MSRTVCGECWCLYDELDGSCACPKLDKGNPMTKTIDALVEALELAMKYAAPAMARDKQSPSNAQWMVEAVMQQETFIKEALAQARAEQAEPVYQCQLANEAWVDQTKDSYDYNLKYGATNVRILYTTPPAAPVAKLEPLTEDEITDATKHIGMNAPLARWNIARAVEAAHNAKLGGAG